MAQCGYSYEQVQSMPTWLFWSMVEAREIELSRDRIGQYHSTAMGMGSFDKGTSKELMGDWGEGMKRSIRGKAIKKKAISRDERAAIWGGER